MAVPAPQHTVLVVHPWHLDARPIVETYRTPPPLHLLVISVRCHRHQLLIVGAHLKARPTEPRSCAQREAQASVLAELVRQEGFEAGRHVVLMGDLNDFDDEVPDAEGNAPTSAVLRMLSSELGLHRYSPVPSTPGFGP